MAAVDNNNDDNKLSKAVVVVSLLPAKDFRLLSEVVNKRVDVFDE
jgi:hypothetical protein